MNQHDFLRILIKEDINRQLLYEGLIFSYSPDIIISKLKKFGFRDVVYNGKTININFVLSNQNKEIYEKLNGFLTNVCGWFHGISIAGGMPTKDKIDFLKHKSGNVILQYEAKFDIEVSKVPNELYHLTTCLKLDKILNNGLTPRSSTEYFNFQDRVYLSANKQSLVDLSKQKLLINKKHCFIVLKVSTNGVSDRIRFFVDPNFSNGFYTLENIPNSALEPIEKIMIDNKNNILTTPI